MEFYEVGTRTAFQNSVCNSNRELSSRMQFAILQIEERSSQFKSQTANHELRSGNANVPTLYNQFLVSICNQKLKSSQ